MTNWVRVSGVSGCDLAPSKMSVAEFKERAIEENGFFVLTETTVDAGALAGDTGCSV